ncbi:acyltransferase family protein [bacterium]|nr:acyltransferase family protein [bacterium]
MRYHYLDTLRAGLMLYGVFLHGALPYTTQGGWLLADAGRHPVFDLIVYANNQFRMPAFFLIGGFFSWSALRSKGAGSHVRERLIRIAIPLVVTALVINLSQSWILSTLGVVRFPAHYVGGGWNAHLWFLVDLLIYCLAVAAVWPVVQHWNLRGWLRLDGWRVYLLPLFSMACLKLGYCLVPSRRMGGIDLWEVFQYAPFFLAGMVWARSLACGHSLVGLANLCVLLGLGVVGELSDSLPHVADVYASAALRWSTAFLCIVAFQRFANFESKLVKTISASSYTVYLFHHIIVVLVAGALLSVTLPPALKFLIVVASAFAGGFLIHSYAIRRVRFLEFLFNGKYPGRGRLDGRQGRKDKCRPISAQPAFVPARGNVQ